MSYERDVKDGRGAPPRGTLLGLHDPRRPRPLVRSDPEKPQPADSSTGGEMGQGFHVDRRARRARHSHRVGLRASRLGLAVLLAASCDSPYPSQPPPPSPTPTPVPTATPIPAPTPCPIPETCPPLALWSVGVHHYLDGNAQLIPGPKVGGVALMDTTPRFGDGRDPCNNENHAVCSNECGAWRRCEDPRGAIWKVEGPASLINVQLPGEDCLPSVRCGYQARVRLDAPGLVEVTTCPPPDLHDREDPARPVEVTGHGCGSFRFTVPRI